MFPYGHKRRDSYILSSIVVLYTLFLTFLIPWGKPLGSDIVHRLYLFQGDIYNTFHNVEYLELSPPGWHLISHVLVAISPFHPIVTLQTFNALLLLLSIPVVYKLGQLCTDHLTGLLAAALFPLNVTVIAMVVRGDHYMLLTLSTAGLITSACMLLYQRSDSRYGYWVYAIVCLLTASLHYYAWATIAAAGLLGLLHLRLNRSRAKYWVLAHVPAGVFAVMWLPRTMAQISYRSSDHADSGFSLIGTKGVVQALIPMDIALSAHLLVLAVVGTFGLLTAVAAVYGVVNYTQQRFRFLWVTLVISAGLIMIYGMLRSGVAARHAVFLSPLSSVVVAAGLVAAIGHLRKAESVISRRNSIGHAVLVSSIVLFFGIGFWGVATFDTTEYDPNGYDVNGDQYLMAANFVDTQVAEGPESTVVLATGASDSILGYYGDGRYPIYGVPDPSFTDSHRMQTPIHNMAAYNSTNRTHVGRLLSLVNDADRVVLYAVHQDTSELNKTLRTEGFRRNTSFQSRYVEAIVFDRRGSCQMAGQSKVA